MRCALTFEPIDGWSFRDGRPFEAGEAFEAASLFPPSPWTILGAVRSALLRQRCAEPERYAGRPGPVPCRVCGEGPCRAIGDVGRPDGPPPFRLGPALLARIGSGTVSAWYPVPADLGRGGESGLPVLLEPATLPSGTEHSLPGLAPLLPGKAGRVLPWPGGWISRSDLERWLNGSPPKLEEESAAPSVVREPRIGVGIDPGVRSVREGQLYLRDVVRLEDGAGLAVSVDDALVGGLEGEVARLGGDGRLARISTRAVDLWPPAPVLDGRRFKLYLAAPTWFSGGWRPGWVDPAEGRGTIPGTAVRVRLVAAALAGPQPIGGWDLRRQRPRGLRRMAAAGSVYFFEIEAGDSGAVAALHGGNVNDPSSDAGATEWMTRAGFGLALVGRW